MPKVFNKKVLVRFMTEDELETLEEKYEGAKKRWGWGWVPTQDDWDFFQEHKGEGNTEIFEKKWKVQKPSVYARLGKMSIYKSQKADGDK